MTFDNEAKNTIQAMNEQIEADRSGKVVKLSHRSIRHERSPAPVKEFSELS
jgi:hypothetical protein